MHAWHAFSGREGREKQPNAAGPCSLHKKLLAQCSVSSLPLTRRSVERRPQAGLSVSSRLRKKVGPAILKLVKVSPLTRYDRYVFELVMLRAEGEGINFGLFIRIWPQHSCSLATSISSILTVLLPSKYASMTTPTYDMPHDATRPVLDLPPGTELIHGFDKYIIIAPIETVNGSHVYDAYNIEQAIRVVLKVVDWTKANRALYGTVSQPIIEDGQMRPSYASELHLLSYVRHENIVRLLDMFCYEVEDSEATWLVMVFETHGVLSTVVQTSESRTDIVSDSWNLAMVCASPAWHQIFMGEDTTRYIFCQVVEAVRYLFSEAIVHQDLILENILVDPQLRIKLANLTSAIWHHPNAMVSFKAGTVDYWPPEMRQDDLSDDGSVGQHNLAAAEIYALGCILLELVQPRGHRIYDLEYIPENPKKLSIIALEVLDADGPPNERWSAEGWEHCRRLILSCRDDDWRRRPTIDELLRNAWLVPEVQGMF